MPERDNFTIDTKTGPTPIKPLEDEMLLVPDDLQELVRPPSVVIDKRRSVKKNRAFKI